MLSRTMMAFLLLTAGVLVLLLSVSRRNTIFMAIGGVMYVAALVLFLYQAIQVGRRKRKPHDDG